MVDNCTLATMPPRYAHVVHLRLTHEERRLVAEMARLRRLSVEDLLREGLRLGGGDAQGPPAERARLRSIVPGVESEHGGGR